MEKDIQRRNWVFTINNPQQTEQELMSYLQTLEHVKYIAFGLEKGDGTEQNPDGTKHYQGYIEFSQGKWWTTIKNYFSEPNVKPNANIDFRKGTRQQAHDYIFKLNEYADKAHTKIGETYEFGKFIKNGERTDIADFFNMLEQKASNKELRSTHQNLYSAYGVEKIERFRNDIDGETWSKRCRNVEVTYIYGSAGWGKNKFINKQVGLGNAYSVLYDKYAFANYKGHPAIVFNEYRGQFFKITEINEYLDVWPLELRAFGGTRWAQYDKVFILSNSPITDLFKDVQLENKKLWEGFLRRIHHIYKVEDDNILIKEKETIFEDVPEDEIEFEGWTKRIEKTIYYDANGRPLIKAKQIQMPMLPTCEKTPFDRKEAK